VIVYQEINSSHVEHASVQDIKTKQMKLVKRKILAGSEFQTALSSTDSETVHRGAKDSAIPSSDFASLT
jgi:hypothetical protein